MPVKTQLKNICSPSIPASCDGSENFVERDRDGFHIGHDADLVEGHRRADMKGGLG